MPWTVETLNALVDKEVAALPADMRARLVRLTELIEQIGFEALPCQASRRSALGISRDREGWNLACDVCDGDWTAGGDPTGLHQEDPEDARQRAKEIR
jgi:hypothetical protein